MGKCKKRDLKRKFICNGLSKVLPKKRSSFANFIAITKRKFNPKWNEKKHCKYISSKKLIKLENFYSKTRAVDGIKKHSPKKEALNNTFHKKVSLTFCKVAETKDCLTIKEASYSTNVKKMPPNSVALLYEQPGINNKEESCRQSVTSASVTKQILKTNSSSAEIPIANVLLNPLTADSSSLKNESWKTGLHTCTHMSVSPSTKICDMEMKTSAATSYLLNTNNKRNMTNKNMEICLPFSMIGYLEKLKKPHLKTTSEKCTTCCGNSSYKKPYMQQLGLKTSNPARLSSAKDSKPEDTIITNVSKSHGNKIQAAPQCFKKNAVYCGTGKLPCPDLGPGWFFEQIVRQNGKSAGKFDVYYHSPNKVRLRSKLKLQNFLGASMQLDNFDYNAGRFLKENEVLSKKIQSLDEKILEKLEHSFEENLRGEGSFWRGLFFSRSNFNLKISDQKDAAECSQLMDALRGDKLQWTPAAHKSPCISNANKKPKSVPAPEQTSTVVDTMPVDIAMQNLKRKKRKKQKIVANNEQQIANKPKIIQQNNVTVKSTSKKLESAAYLAFKNEVERTCSDIVGDKLKVVLERAWELLCDKKKNCYNLQKQEILEPDIAAGRLKKTKRPLCSSSLVFTPIRSARRQCRCKECAACRRPNCGKCIYCRDMKQFGGKGKKKQVCIYRKCKFMKSRRDMSYSDLPTMVPRNSLQKKSNYTFACTESESLKKQDSNLTSSSKSLLPLTSTTPVSSSVIVSDKCRENTNITAPLSTNILEDSNLTSPVDHSSKSFLPLTSTTSASSSVIVSNECGENSNITAPPSTNTFEDSNLTSSPVDHSSKSLLPLTSTTSASSVIVSNECGENSNITAPPSTNTFEDSNLTSSPVDHSSKSFLPLTSTTSASSVIVSNICGENSNITAPPSTNTLEYLNLAPSSVDHSSKSFLPLTSTTPVSSSVVLSDECGEDTNITAPPSTNTLTVVAVVKMKNPVTNTTMTSSTTMLKATSANQSSSSLIDSAEVSCPLAVVHPTSCAQVASMTCLVPAKTDSATTCLVPAKTDSVLAPLPCNSALSSIYFASDISTKDTLSSVINNNAADSNLVCSALPCSGITETLPFDSSSNEIPSCSKDAEAAFIDQASLNTDRVSNDLTISSSWIDIPSNRAENNENFNHSSSGLSPPSRISCGDNDLFGSSVLSTLPTNSFTPQQKFPPNNDALNDPSHPTDAFSRPSTYSPPAEAVSSMFYKSPIRHLQKLVTHIPLNTLDRDEEVGGGSSDCCGEIDKRALKPFVNPKKVLNCSTPAGSCPISNYLTDSYFSAHSNNSQNDKFSCISSDSDKNSGFQSSLVSLSFVDLKPPTLRDETCSCATEKTEHSIIKQTGIPTFYANHPRSDHSNFYLPSSTIPQIKPHDRFGNFEAASQLDLLGPSNPEAPFISTTIASIQPQHHRFTKIVTKSTKRRKRSSTDAGAQSFNPAKSPNLSPHINGPRYLHPLSQITSCQNLPDVRHSSET